MKNQDSPVKRLLFVLGVGVMVPLGLPVAGACPMCSQSLAPPTPAAGPDGGGSDTPRSGSGLAEGFYYSILLMLGTPLLLAAGLGGMLVMVMRSQRQSPHSREAGSEGALPGG